jgi:carboxypeptidase Taq
MTPRDAYAELLRRSRERALLASCLELLSWDELTFLPPGGVAFRGRQMAYMAGLLHAAATDPLLGELLDCAARSDLTADPHSATAVNLRQWRWHYDRHCRVPRSLVEELADVTTIAQQVWAEARQRDRFDEFLPWLERVTALKRSQGACLAAGGDPYDALLEDFEPGVTSAQLTELFAQLQRELTPLLAMFRNRPGEEDGPLRGPFPIDRQHRLACRVAEQLGFDFHRGRIDTTTHPFFSPVGPGDCRITTRYCESDFREGFFAVLHEVGHGLYEQGIDPELHGTPLGEAPSLGLHESQSRLWENGVGRSRSFWEYFYPEVQGAFPEALADVSLTDLVRSLNRVQPGLNRVRADRVTYDLHILVRFELEQALIRGELAPADLPGVWRDRYHDALGIAPDNDAEGCLQDGHWSAGQFGYFPTYTLGNIYAAQLLEAARRDLPSLDADFASGDFHPLREWLHRQVYSRGQKYTAVELIKRVTGRPPHVAPLVRALQTAVG